MCADLSEAQIAALMALSSVLMEPEPPFGRIAAYCAMVGIEFGRAFMLRQANRAEQLELPQTAEAWFRAASVAGKFDERPLRAFCARTFTFSKFRYSFRNMTEAESRTLARRWLARAVSTDASVDDLDQAAYACKQVADKEGLEAILQIAIRKLLFLLFDDCLTGLGRGLTTGEIEQLRFALMGVKVSPTQGWVAFQLIPFIKKYKLEALKHQALLVALEDGDYTEFTAIADELEMPVETSHLIRLYKIVEDQFVSQVAIAEELEARGVDSWKGRTLRLFAEKRSVALSNGDISSAEVYGKKCGQPLTEVELRAFLRTAGRNPQNHVESFEEKHARRLLADLIYAETNGHPPG